MSVIIKQFIVTFDNREKLEIIFQPGIQLEPGNILAVIGDNGAGKTTLLEILAGLKKTIIFEGEIMGCKQPTKLNPNKLTKIGFLPSNPSLFFSKPTIREEFEHITNLTGNNEWIRWEEKWHYYSNNSPFSLSWGEQRSLILDLLFSQGAEIYLLDDFIVSLDHVESLHVGKQIFHLLKEKKIVIVVSRDPKVLYYLPVNTIIYSSKIIFQNRNKKTIFEKCRENNPFSVLKNYGGSYTSNKV